jgi:hypothetical protein
MNRRELAQGLALSAAVLSLKKSAFATLRIGARVGANDKLTIGCIGVGSQGRAPASGNPSGCRVRRQPR